MPVTLADLVTPANADDVLAQELLLAKDLGLPTTAWQPVQAVPVIMDVQANVTAAFSEVAAEYAQGGYASYAALMVDSQGNPIETWMDLRASDQYMIKRSPPTFAGGFTPYTNTSASTYSFSPSNPLHFQHPTKGATYTSVGTGTIPPGTGTIQIQADVAGAASTAGAGETLVMLTPFAGVTMLALTSSVVGADAETNAALLVRGQAKLGTVDNSLSNPTQPVPFPGAPDSAYQFVATTIPQGTLSAVPPYAVSQKITRVGVQTDPDSGTVIVSLANASGGSGSGDIDVVDKAIQALITPDSVTVQVFGASTSAFNGAATVYITQAAGVTAAQAAANIDDRLALFFAGVPVGGVTTATPNIVPLSDIGDQIFAANHGTVDVRFSATTADVSLGTTGVPVLGTFTVTVVFV